MNMEQMQAAKAAMAEWLAHPQELGHEPAEIECAGTFELHEMTYYLFKYRAEAGAARGCLAYATVMKAMGSNIAGMCSAKWKNMTSQQPKKKLRQW